MSENTKQKVSDYFKSLINIDQDCDVEATIANINESSEFKGLNVWILIFAILLASIGLNVNSTAVIIGAMLVSPLMGPIMGIGLAIGRNDLKMLRKSLKNLLIMVIISLFVSTFYFFITPLSDAQSELLARTRPTIFDVMIASFGGFAGIIASSRKQEKTTIVSGVAIATALMPPLCTAGYGLGTFQFNYFFGAFYLFFINSFFIALATFIMVKYLNFPAKEYIDEKRQRKVRRTISIFTLIVAVPSIFIAINVIRETTFNTNSIKYINDIEKSELFPDSQIIKSERDYENKAIELAFVGKALNEEQKLYLKVHLEECNLNDVTLSIRQANSEAFDITQQSQFIQNLLDKKDEELKQYKEQTEKLNQEITLLKTKNKVQLSQLSNEIQVLEPNVEKIAMGQINEIDITNDSTIHKPIITIYWKNKPTDKQINHISKWLKIRTNENEIMIENK